MQIRQKVKIKSFNFTVNGIEWRIGKSSLWKYFQINRLNNKTGIYEFIDKIHYQSNKKEWKTFKNIIKMIIKGKLGNNANTKNL